MSTTHFGWIHLPATAVVAGHARGAAAERRQVPRLVHLNGSALRRSKTHAREVCRDEITIQLYSLKSTSQRQYIVVYQQKSSRSKQHKKKFRLVSDSQIDTRSKRFF